MDLNGYSTKFKWVDTVAEATAISEKSYGAMQSPRLSVPGKALHGPPQQQLHSLG